MPRDAASSPFLAAFLAVTPAILFADIINLHEQHEEH
jgi:hypothetical protein